MKPCACTNERRGRYSHLMTGNLQTQYNGRDAVQWPGRSTMTDGSLQTVNCVLRAPPVAVARHAIANYLPYLTYSTVMPCHATSRPIEEDPFVNSQPASDVFHCQVEGTGGMARADAVVVGSLRGCSDL